MITKLTKLLTLVVMYPATVLIRAISALVDLLTRNVIWLDNLTDRIEDEADLMLDNLLS